MCLLFLFVALPPLSKPSRTLFPYTPLVRSKNLRTLAYVSPAVEGVVGYPRDRVQGAVRATSGAGATITVVDRGGIARDLPLRTEQNPVLRGTKHQVAADQELLVGRGRSDGRTIVIIPEVKAGTTTGITLLHVRLADRLSAAPARGRLAGYRPKPGTPPGRG